MKSDSLLLYAVTDRSWLNGKSLAWQVEEALKGGITMLQLREKNLPEEEFYQEAQEIKNICSQYQVSFLINDNVELACRVHADGVHVGQSDMEVLQAREQIGKNKILGVSAQTVKQAVLAEKQGADYLGVGAVFATNSKTDAKPVDLVTLREICQAVSIPVIAIGGINKENLGQLSGTGICGVAVISAIFAQKEIADAARQLKKECERICRR